MIVGVSTKSTGKKKPYLLVKNCHGPNWGKNGFSKMDFEMVSVVCEPFLTNKNIADVRKRERNLRNLGIGIGKKSILERMVGKSFGLIFISSI